MEGLPRRGPFGELTVLDLSTVLAGSAVPASSRQNPNYFAKETPTGTRGRPADRPIS
jgi:hypothetical protein